MLALAVVTGLEVDGGGTGSAATRAGGFLERIVAAFEGEGASAWGELVVPLRAVIDALLRAGAKPQAKPQPSATDKPRAALPQTDDTTPPAQGADAETEGTDATTAAAALAAAAVGALIPWAEPARRAEQRRRRPAVRR
jgi:hypothetical protein